MSKRKRMRCGWCDGTGVHGVDDDCPYCAGRGTAKREPDDMFAHRRLAEAIEVMLYGQTERERTGREGHGSDEVQ